MTEGVPVDRGGSIRVGEWRVRRVGLGTNRVTDTPVVRAFLRHAMESGIDFLDTADVYMSGVSEETIGAVLPGAPGARLVATKGGLVRTPQGYEPDGTPEHLREAVHRSLARLRRDRLDLYFLHRVDPRVPIEVSMDTLKELQQAGQIGQLGVSNVSVAELERARREARIVCVQNRYNVVDREHEDVLRYCEEHGLAFIPWSPLQRGRIAVPGPLIEVAQRRGVTPYQVALAWLLQRSPVILPIPGTLSDEHLQENLAAVELKLDRDEVRELDSCEVTRPSGRDGA